VERVVRFLALTVALVGMASFQVWAGMGLPSPSPVWMLVPVAVALGFSAARELGLLLHRSSGSHHRRAEVTVQGADGIETVSIHLPATEDDVLRIAITTARAAGLDWEDVPREDRNAILDGTRAALHAHGWL